MSTTAEPGTVIDALCCECGTVRTVKRSYVGGAGERRLRCATCRATTPHAPIRDVNDDYREHLNAARPVRGDLDPLDVVRSLGWTVIEVADLRAMASVVRSVGVVLVRPNLVPDDLVRVAERVLSPEGGA
ncbi:hypothetical protein [Cellulomonas sp. P24]|uniref:hypothetical protein n=1 Tax=Cellulomonas sp. P24 TaxID=2885206 RepID=UPI00216AE34D|nr:hypothetical protein [Cellulomonas sp. P24]MCR6491717.1 hypothetical protein [Cellulomonas sp. P24]